MAKYLARLGWDVSVVTPDASLWRHAEEPDKVEQALNREGITRISTGHRFRWLSPYELRCWNRGVGRLVGGVLRKTAYRLGIDRAIGWISEAERACESLVADHVDVVLATGPPFSSFELARRLAQKWSCPYVLDYRDIWLNSGGGRHSERVIRVAENNLVDSASSVIAISQSLLKRTEALASKLRVITNGFDPEEMEKVKPHDFGHFAIVYAGSFYPPKTAVTPLMEALSRLKATEPYQIDKWRFHYYGSQIGHVMNEAVRLGVEDQVSIHGVVTRREALSAIRGSGVSVVITYLFEDSNSEHKGIVTGKLFDAIGLGVPILVIGPRGSDVESIIETSGSARLVTAGQIDEMVGFLKAVMSGDRPRSKSPEVYGWPNLAKRLDHLLRELTALRIRPGKPGAVMESSTVMNRFHRMPR